MTQCFGEQECRCGMYSGWNNACSDLSNTDATVMAGKFDAIFDSCDETNAFITFSMCLFLFQLFMRRDPAQYT